jgi:DNA-binding XRE family transcriptional regulator
MTNHQATRDQDTTMPHLLASNRTHKAARSRQETLKLITAALGSPIDELRKAKGLTQAKLAKLLGCTRECVTQLENGRGLPSVPLLLKLYEHLVAV